MPKNLRFVQLEITAANTMPDPEPCRCNPGDKLHFVITNDDSTAHWVSINSADIKLKEDLSAANPLVPGSHMVKVNPGETDIIKGHKLQAVFGKAQPLKFTTYKYTVVWADNQGLTTNQKLKDPDFDVTPP